MNTKYKVVSQLAAYMAERVVSDREEWMKYLDMAGRLYKYSFREQMTIYGQRPEATACASLEVWNTKMNCWVNRGAKGIALPNPEGKRPGLRYVFDIADVHLAERAGHFPHLWKLEEVYKKPVLDSLEEIYGSTNPETVFEDRLVEIAERITLACYEDFLPDLYHAREGSILEGMDELNAGLCLRETLFSSVAYTLLSRCGADMSVWKREFHFDYIHEFNTLKVLEVVGNAAVEICRDILMEIGRTVRKLERQAEREGQWDAAIKMAGEVSLKRAGKGIADGGNRKSDGGVQGGRPDEMGGGQMPPQEKEEKIKTDEQIEAILRTGGGRDNSRSRIYAKYRQGKMPGEMAEFLKNEYGTAGKGFDFDGNPVSVWFDSSGMRIGHGMSAREDPATAMDWPEIEGVIRAMVENGSYMGADEASLVDAVERERISGDLYNFFRDGIGETPESIPVRIYDYPESVKNLCELLSAQEGRNTVTGELVRIKKQLEAGEKQIKWRYVKSPEHLLMEIAGLCAEKKEYPVRDSVDVLQEDFITQDEIDFVLARGSGVEGGSFRIYEYFLGENSREEAVSFLKKEYGTGGMSDALAGTDHSWEHHDAKGIRLEKGDLRKPYAEILLPWKTVEKRIRELVWEDSYLSPEGKAAYMKYKEREGREKTAEYGKERMPAGSSGEKDSLKEKLSGMAARLDREKACGQKPGIQKNLGKEEAL